jgi:hypothetical protein
MEEGEEEQWGDDDIFAEYGAFNDTAMGEAEEEVGAKEEPVEEEVGAEEELLMILVRPFVTHKENAKVKRRRSSLTAC